MPLKIVGVPTQFNCYAMMPGLFRIGGTGLQIGINLMKDLFIYLKSEYTKNHVKKVFEFFLQEDLATISMAEATNGLLT